MPTADTILLLPPEGDPHGLLKPGRAGARPPILTWCWDEIGDEPDRWCEPSMRWRPNEPVRQTLVLAIDGEAVEFGEVRAARVLKQWWWADTPRRIRCWARGDRTATYLLHPDAPVRVILCDRDGREISTETTDG